MEWARRKYHNKIKWKKTKLFSHFVTKIDVELSPRGNNASDMTALEKVIYKMIGRLWQETKFVLGG